MSQGEETIEPITGDDHFSVVISGDGSAAIDGVPVPVADGEAADAAILDMLHRHARDRDNVVTAAISDPSAGYVARVAVAPDGSSRLLEQKESPEHPDIIEVDLEESPDDDLDVSPDDDLDVSPDDELDEYGTDFGDDGHDAVPEDDVDEDHEFDEASYALPEPPPPPPSPNPFSTPDPTPNPTSSRSPGMARTPPPMITRNRDRTSDSRQSDEEYEHRGFLHRPLVVAPAAVALAGIVVVSLVILGSSGSDGGDQKETARSSRAMSKSPTAVEAPPAPTFSVSISPPPPPTGSASPSKSPSATVTPKPKGGEAVVTITATPPRSVTTVTAKPAVDTAASAVKRLAESDPDGRHICYRAYVSRQGWQKPVCDGTVAGTTGQNKAIKALNIAVYGSGGASANAALYNSSSTDGQGRWNPHWTAVTGDNKDFYIGDTSAKYITGFAINIGGGHVCQTAKVHGYSWGSRGCADRRPDYIFGGSMENTRFLEAVEFTV